MSGLFARNAPPEPAQTAPAGLPSVFEILSALADIGDEQWAGYAFLREPLRGRFTAGQQWELTHRAAECGKETAEQLIRRLGETDPAAIAAKLGVTVRNSRAKTGSVSRNLLAIYQEPDEITIYTNGLEKAARFFHREECPPTLRGTDLYAVILAHELFHVLEYRYRDSLWCCTYQTQLWKLGPLKRNTRLSVLPEISAMAFSKRLNALPCIPYFAEAAMLYAKSPADGCALFRMMADCAVPDKS